MPKARPKKTKDRVLNLYADGLTPKEIAMTVRIPVSTIKNWIVGLPKHSTGFSRRLHGPAAARVARVTGRNGESIRREMKVKEKDPCVFCGSVLFDEQQSWYGSVFHHYEDGRVDRAHRSCNATRRH